LLSRCSMLFFRRQATAAAAVPSPSTKDVYTALAIVQDDRTSRDALIELMVLDALFSVGPRRRCELSPSTHRTFIPLSPSCGAIVQVETSSLRSRARCPSLASGRHHCCALAVHIGRLSYRSRYRAKRLFKSRRALCAHGARCPSVGIDRRRRRSVCSRRPLIGRSYRSRHCARRSFKSRRARCTLMVLDVLL